MIIRLLFVSAILMLKSNAIILKECCGRCVGSANCTACSTCNYCGYCNSGGSCSVCGPKDIPIPVQPYNYKRTSPNSEQRSPQTSIKQTSRNYYVYANLLNVRCGPGINYPAIDRLEYLTSVLLISEFSNGWCKISYQKDYFFKEGFVLKKYISHYSL